MATLQVRDLPEDLHRRLAELAEKEHRSLAQQVTVLLMRALESVDSDKRRREKVLDSIKNEPLVRSGKRHKDPVKLVREDRSR